MMQRLLLFLMRLFGWTLVTNNNRVSYADNSYVYACYPHTSNWDGILTVASFLALGLRGSIVAKQEIKRLPILGPLLSRLGIFFYIDKNNKSSGSFSQTKEALNGRSIVLAIEGTRKAAKVRTGFHFLSKDLGLDIVPCTINYREKKVILGAPYTPGDEPKESISKLHEFVSKEEAKRIAKNPSGVKV